jgi:hypothetical protein
MQYRNVNGATKTESRKSSKQDATACENVGRCDGMLYCAGESEEKKSVENPCECVEKILTLT